jgi:hypothetical protein
MRHDGVINQYFSGLQSLARYSEINRDNISYFVAQYIINENGKEVMKQMDVIDAYRNIDNVLYEVEDCRGYHGRDTKKLLKANQYRTNVAMLPFETINRSENW